MKDLSYLVALTRNQSPSGREKQCQDVVENFIKPYADNIWYDSMGNLIASKGNGLNGILISAHVDQICMIVKKIEKDNCVSVLNGGGIDRKIVPGQRLNIMLDSGELVPAVCLKKPIHEEFKTKDYDKVQNIDEFKVWIGNEKRVKVGNYVTFDSFLTRVDSNIISPSLDDKICIYLCSRIFRDYDKSSDVTLYFASLVGEETGLRGARHVVECLKDKVQVSIDFDVTFDDTLSPNRSDIRMGKGPVIAFGADKDYDLAMKLESLGTSQREATRPGGTNTDALQIGLEAKTAHIGIPLLNVHQENEIIDMRDVEGAESIMLKYLKEY